MVTDVNAVGRMSQCSVYVNCQTSNGECLSDPLPTYTDMPTQIQIFFQKGEFVLRKRSLKKIVLLTYTRLMCMNTKIRQTYYSFSLLYLIFFWGLFVLLCFILKFEGEYIPYTPPPPPPPPQPPPQTPNNHTAPPNGLHLKQDIQ